jgi:hypothetical protein
VPGVAPGDETIVIGTRRRQVAQTDILLDACRGVARTVDEDLGRAGRLDRDIDDRRLRSRRYRPGPAGTAAPPRAARRDDRCRSSSPGPSGWQRSPAAPQADSCAAPRDSRRPQYRPGIAAAHDQGASPAIGKEAAHRSAKIAGAVPIGAADSPPDRPRCPRQTRRRKRSSCRPSPAAAASASTSAGGRAHGPPIQRASASAVRTLAGRAVARRPT